MTETRIPHRSKVLLARGVLLPHESRMEKSRTGSAIQGRSLIQRSIQNSIQIMKVRNIMA